MAKPLSEITKVQFTKDYNITEVLTSKTSIMSRLKTFNENKQAVAFGDKKPPRDTMPAWFKKWNDEVYEKRQPAWFKKWNDEVYEKRQPAWFKKWNKEVFEEVIKLNNLKTK